MTDIPKTRQQFEIFRQAKRQGIDLSIYKDSALSWLNDQILQYFTFLYGREVLNLETGQFEFDRLLDNGERDFGGYDSLILWGTYPRLGIDERSQWDFYNDFPQGKKGLRAGIERIHARGVKVFIPYTPWDQSNVLHGKKAVDDDQELALLIQEIDADGVYLDTMSAADPTMKLAIEIAHPGAVFCSEGRAMGTALQEITCSWEQSQSRSYEQGNWSANPEFTRSVDRLRFVFPEHRLFVVSRFATGADRKRLIQRGFFNGMGWVVWQDIFGYALPYTPEEAALLKKCRTIFREHRSTIWGPNPYPLIPTLVPEVYCNEFVGGGKRIWVFYNANDYPIMEEVIRIDNRKNTHFVDLWNLKEIHLKKPGLIPTQLEPQSVGAVAEMPIILNYSVAERQIRLSEPILGADLYLQAAEKSWTLELEQETQISADLSTAQKVAPLLVSLKRNEEVLDQMWVYDDSPYELQSARNRDGLDPRR